MTGDRFHCSLLTKDHLAIPASRQVNEGGLLSPPTGQPSRCYIYEGDGVCEEFEKGSSVRDCGYFTPVGYTDQWASTAWASHHDQRCPASAATGEPSLSQVVLCSTDTTVQYRHYSAVQTLRAVRTTFETTLY